MPLPALIAAVLPMFLQMFLPKLGDLFSGLTEGKVTIEEARERTTQIATEAWADVQKSMVAAQRDVIVAETNSESWLTRNWRPTTMMVFLWIIFWYAWLQPALVVWIGMTPFKPAFLTVDKLINLLSIGLGGYVGGRSIEKALTNYRTGRPVLSGVMTAPVTSDAAAPAVRPKKRHGPKGQ